jgi:hypothetical protein
MSSEMCPLIKLKIMKSPMRAPRPPTTATIRGEKELPNLARAIIAGAVVNTEVKKRPAIKELSM